MNTATANDWSDSDAFWEQKITEAEAAGGSIEINESEIPPVPGVAFCLPGPGAGAGKKLDFVSSPAGTTLTVRPAR